MKLVTFFIVFLVFGKLFQKCSKLKNDYNENTQFGFLCDLFTSLLDRGNDNWLINYEKIPEVDRQVEGEEGVSIF